VSTYNAGEYGTNGGGPGGSFQSIPQNSGLFRKNDIGDVSPGNGELAVLFGSVHAHSGDSGLVLRAKSEYGDTGGDGADYNYSFDSRDFGAAPSLITSGTLSIDYWLRAQTNLLGTTGQATSTEFLNASGNAVFAIATMGQGTPLVTAPTISWMDAGGWHDTSIVANNNGWDKVMLSFDLMNDVVSFSYYSSLDSQTYNFAINTGSAAAIDSLSGIHFTAVPGTEENAFDDFVINAPVVVPEPCGVLMVLIGGLQCLVLRRRRKA